MKGVFFALLQALWSFAPALFANQCPGFARKLGLWLSETPVWEKALGPKKTVAAYYAGIFGAVAVICLQSRTPSINASIGLFDYKRGDLLLLGAVFGLGAILGDHAKSFLKRRLGMAPGERWWPFDQTDFLAGATIATMPFVWVGWGRLSLLLLFVACVYHPIGNWIGYKLKLRETPW